MHNVEQADLKSNKLSEARRPAKIVLEDAMMGLNRSIEEIEMKRIAMTIMYNSIDWVNITSEEEIALWYFFTYHIYKSTK